MQTLTAQSLSEEEQKVFRLYGKLPDRRDLLENKLKVRLARLWFIPAANTG